MKTSKVVLEELEEIRSAITALEADIDKEGATEERNSKYQSLVASEKAKMGELEVVKEREARSAKLAQEAAAVAGSTIQTEGKEERKAKETFSIARAISLVKAKKPLDGVEGELRQEAEKELREFGQGVSDIAVPSWAVRMEKRTDIDQTTSAIQPTEVGAYVDALREAGLWSRVGVEVIEGLTADYKIPIVGKQTVGWASAENAAAADGGTNFTSATLNPTRTTAYVDISNRVLLQNGAGAQIAVMRDVARSTAQLWNTAMMATASVSNAPGSIAATSGVGTFTEEAYAALVSVKKDINLAEQALADNQGLDGKICIVLATNLMTELRQAAQVSSVSPVMTGEGMNRFLLGYPAFFTVAATKSAGTSGDFIMGDFSYVKMGLFGGLNIQVDPYTVNINDEVRLVLHRYVDWALTQGGAFVKATSVVA